MMEQVPAGTPRSLRALAPGLVLPFVIVSVTRTHYAGDIGAFMNWADCLWRGGGSLYEGCANYPVVGVLASGGVVGIIQHAFHLTDQATIATVFRYYLAFVDAVQFVLLSVLLRGMGAKRPHLLAFVVMALPSAWAGGSMWGQIDGVTQVFLLASLVVLGAGFRAIHDGRLTSSALCLAVGITCCMLALLTKQLAIFSMPWLLLAAGVGYVQLARRWRWRGIGVGASALAAALAACVFLDRTFPVARQFGGSSLLYVWFGGGSDHDRVISASGFNLWMLLGRAMDSSSMIPFHIIRIGGVAIPLTPNQCGKVLFVMASMGLLFLYAGAQGGRAWLREPARPFAQGERARFLALLGFAAGLENLIANVTLVGTHERYLYHGYPMLLLACLYLWQEPRRLVDGRVLALLLASAGCYGGFVYSVIGDLPWFLFPLRRHELMATLHIVLLVFLLDAIRSVAGRAGRAVPLDRPTGAGYRA